MSSGIKPSDDAIKTYERVKGNELDWVIFKIDKELIVVDKVFPDSEDGLAKKKADKKDEEATYSKFKDNVYDDFQEMMQTTYKTLPCFALIDFRFMSDDGPRGKLSLIQWCPDSGAKIKDKMLLASSADAFKQKLEGLHCKLQFAAVSDFDYDEIRKAVPQK